MLGVCVPHIDSEYFIIYPLAKEHRANTLKSVTLSGVLLAFKLHLSHLAEDLE
jgi:hypothetical protein